MSGRSISLAKEAPITRAVTKAGRIIPLAILRGLHHQYARICFATGTALESSIHRLGFNSFERQRLCCFRFSRVVERVLQHLVIEMDIVARHPR